MSKFSGITYPFFGMRIPPKDIIYQDDKVYFVRQHITTLLDDYNIPYNSYIRRLLYFDSNDIDRLRFTYTAYSLENIILSKIPWGIDNTGKIFNLKEKETFKTKISKIERTKGNLIWIKGVSYPFNLSLDASYNINKHLFAEIVFIDNKWYLYNFTYKYKKRDTIKL